MFSLPLSFMLAVLIIAVLPLQHQVRNIQMMIDDFIFSDPFKRRHSGYPLPAQSLYPHIDDFICRSAIFFTRLMADK